MGNRVTGTKAPEGAKDINGGNASGEFITLARVVKTQGRHGEVAAEIHSAVPDRFVEGMKLFALPAGAEARRELQLESFWPHKEWLVLKFQGVDSMTAAEALVRCELQVPRYQRAQLEPGWSYVSDLVGCRVFDQGREIGSIADVRFGTGEAPLLVVADPGENTKGGEVKEYAVPFAQAYLDAVDATRREVRMHLPDGLLEINAPLTAEEKQEQSRPEKKKPEKEGKKTKKKKHRPH